MKKQCYYYLFSLVFSMISISCSTSENDRKLSEAYLIANVNGLEFNSDNEISALGFTREIGPEGMVNVSVKALSIEGDVLEFFIENYKGVGKYYFGDHLYNNSWIRYVRGSSAEQWMVKPRSALNLTSNYIEVTRSDDEVIQGKISCAQLHNTLEDVLGAVDGEFSLN